ncbi:MAG: glycosyltransferase family 1 protein, partial [Ectothiorhodospiraceae bacterium]
MNVVHVESGMALYGGALQVLFLLQGLREYPGSHTLVCPEGSAIAEAARERGLRFRPVPIGGDA